MFVAGLDGTLLVSSDHGRSFRLFRLADRQGIADLIELPDGSLLLVGEGGLRRVDHLSDSSLTITRPDFTPVP